MWPAVERDELLPENFEIYRDLCLGQIPRCLDWRDPVADHPTFGKRLDIEFGGFPRVVIEPEAGCERRIGGHVDTLPLRLLAEWHATEPWRRDILTFRNKTAPVVTAAAQRRKRLTDTTRQLRWKLNHE